MKKYLKKINRINYYYFDRSKYLRLDANERTIFFSKKILNKIKNSITSSVLQSYPSTPHQLIKKISKIEQVPSKYIHVAPGADSIIKYLFETTDEKKKIGIIYPTYRMVEVYGKIYQKKLVKIKEKNVLSSLKKINKNFSFFYIANPNQPSGDQLREKQIIKILKYLKKKRVMLILDEAYIDFSKQKSMINLIKNFNNLMIIKTFSKSTGIAGLRFGYFITNPILASAINSVRPIADISSFSIKVAEILINEKKEWKKYLKQIQLSKKYVFTQCKHLKIRFKETHANFFYIYLTQSKINKLINFLKTHKILVRKVVNGIRVSYGSSIQMKYFFDKIKIFLQKEKI